MLDAVDDAAHGQRLAGVEGQLLGQLVGHLEGDRGGVVGQRRDRGHAQGVEGAAAGALDGGCAHLRSP